MDAPATGSTRKRRKRGSKLRRKLGKQKMKVGETSVVEDDMQLEGSTHVEPERKTTSKLEEADLTSDNGSGKERDSEVKTQGKKRKRKGHKHEDSSSVKKAKRDPDVSSDVGTDLNGVQETISSVPSKAKKKHKVKKFVDEDAAGEGKSLKSKKKGKTPTTENSTLRKTGKKSEKKTKISKSQLKSKPKEQRTVFDFDTPEKFLVSLLAPISVDRFFSEYWEKKPLFIQRKDKVFSDTYRTLFSRKILEEILISRNIEFVRDVNVCRFDGEKRQSLNGEGRATRKKIKKLLDTERATVQFHQPQRFQDRLWHINEQLESFFHSLVGANVYMTPRDSQGLAPHYDDVDVFVLQLEGNKQWKLYKPPIMLPRDYSKDLDQSTIGKPTHDILLKPGDLLYFPRGTVHQAVTPADSPSHSTHVTISTYQRSSWGDLLSVALPDILQTALNSDVAFRKGLPCSYLSGDEENFAAHQSQLKKMVQSLGDHLESHDQTAANEMMCDFMANRLPPFIKDGTAHEPRGQMPTEKSKVKLAFPDHIYITKVKRKIAELDIEDSEEDDDDPDSDEDLKSEDKDLESDDEDLESDDKDLESEDEDLEEAGDDDDEEGSEEQDVELEILDGSYLEQIRQTNKEKEEEDDAVQNQFYVYHSVRNTRHDHMMTSEPKQCSGLKFSTDSMAAMKKLLEAKDNWTMVSDLRGSGQMQLLVSLWSEALLEVQRN